MHMLRLLTRHLNRVQGLTFNFFRHWTSGGPVTLEINRPDLNLTRHMIKHTNGKIIKKVPVRLTV